jgi:hypothetical protein
VQRADIPNGIPHGVGANGCGVSRVIDAMVTLMGFPLIAYWAVQPPSTTIVCPVTNDDSSEQSHSTALAISSGRAFRAMGWYVCANRRWLSLPSPPVIRSNSGVSVPPGAIALTLIPFVAYSRAAAFVSPMTACLLAA